jgi:alcohol dehydrogenase class IV
MVSFEIATATRILFGRGRLAEAADAIAALSVGRVLLVTGRSPLRSEALREALGSRGIAWAPFPVESEPSVELAREGVARALAERCEAVVAVGGGSALDCGKAVAALAANGGDPLDYLEVLGRGRPLTVPSLPFVAIPTTAGTGSEVTRNAVLGSSEARVKASLRSPLMLARLAIVDPDLLAGAPSPVLASSGLDALSQLIEPFLSARANPVTDALAREGICRSARSLRRACLVAPNVGPDAEAREDLALASLFGGLCLANAGLGAVHGFAAPVGGMFAAPHGAVCAALLVAALDVNLRALRARAPDHPGAGRFRELAVWLTGRMDAAAEDGIAWLADLCGALRIPGLARHGMTAADVPALVTKARAASSMRANPIVLTDEELTEIAERSLGSW